MCWAKALKTQQVLDCMHLDGDVCLWGVDESYLPVPDSIPAVIHSDGSTAVDGLLASNNEGGLLAIGYPGKVILWTLDSQDVVSSLCSGFISDLSRTILVPKCQAGPQTTHSCKKILHVEFLPEEKSWCSLSSLVICFPSTFAIHAFLKNTHCDKLVG